MLRWFHSDWSRAGIVVGVALAVLISIPTAGAAVSDAGSATVTGADTVESQQHDGFAQLTDTQTVRAAPDGYDESRQQNDTSRSASSHTLEVIPGEEGATYRIQVDGALREGDGRDRNLNADDGISADGERATGNVAGGYQGDSYQYTGEVEHVFLLDGNATFLRDGERVEPKTQVVDYTSCTSARIIGDWENTEIDAHGYTDDGGLDTEVESPNVSAGPTVFDLQETFLPAEQWAVDAVALGNNPATDKPFVHYSEHPNKSSCDDQITPETSTPEPEPEEHTLEIVPDGEDVEYKVVVSDQLEGANVNGRELNSDDSISADGTTATGAAGAGYQGDSYRFTGDIENITTTGDARVLVDGEKRSDD